MKTAILLAAHGAGTVPGLEGARNFEKLCRIRFPGLTLRWAYTSTSLREKIARERRKSDSAAKALMRLFYEKYEAVAIQPLQAISGREYEEARQSSMRVAEETGMKIALGKPLLSYGENLDVIARALLETLPEERGEKENVVFMGHGAKHPAASLYDSLACAVSRLDKFVFIGTLGGKRGLESILPQLNSRRVWLVPLLSMAGGHVINDMAGEHKSSWKSKIISQNHECVPVIRGLSQSPSVSRFWLDNLSAALDSLY